MHSAEDVNVFTDNGHVVRYLGDGALTMEEMNSVLRMCISESQLGLQEDLINELSRVVWNNITSSTSSTSSASSASNTTITFGAFYKTLRSYPAVYDNLTVR